MFTIPTILSSLTYVVLICVKNQMGKYVVKPLTTILIIAVALETDPYLNWIKLAGLVFSLLGDIFLMFKSDIMFICGLVSFLIAHILYIITFNKAKKTDFNLSAMILLPVIGLCYFGILYPDILEDGGAVLLVGVFAYLVAILTMTYTGLLNKNPPLSLGVIMFLISDSLLAFNKFYAKSSNVGYEVGVMITYHIAQFCIAKYHQKNIEIGK